MIVTDTFNDTRLRAVNVSVARRSSVMMETFM